MNNWNNSPSENNYYQTALIVREAKSCRKRLWKVGRLGVNACRSVWEKVLPFMAPARISLGGGGGSWPFTSKKRMKSMRMTNANWSLLRFAPYFVFAVVVLRVLFVCNRLQEYLIPPASHSEHEFGESEALKAIGAARNRTCRKPLLRLWTKSEDLLNPPQSVPDCKALLNITNMRSKRERNWLLAANERWTIRNPHTYDTLMDLVSDCDKFLRLVDFPDKPASKEEAEFPLAYVFIPYRNIAQTIRLFRMIYQPQNIYCINYDTKSDEYYKKIMMNIASCFPNVYLNPNPEPIYYAKYSVLHSVMECLNLLWTSTRRWKYVQIVSWNDFPLKTNWEMVQIFKALNGSQDCELIDDDRPDFITNEAGATEFETNSYIRPVPPAGITIYKGSFATSMSREFIHWMFTDPVAIRFYRYFDQKSVCSEEFYWPSLIHNVQLNPPGGFPGQCFRFFQIYQERKPFLSRYQVWLMRLGPDRVCRGGWFTHASCVFGIRDLDIILTRMELFAHKLYEEFQPALLYCMEMRHWERDCMGETDLDVSYYEELPSVKYHRLPAVEKERYFCVIPP